MTDCTAGGHLQLHRVYGFVKGFVYVFQNIKLQRILANISTNGSFLVFSWQENQWWLPVMKPAGVGVKLWNCWSCLALSSTDITHVSDPPTETDKHQHDASTSVQCGQITAKHKPTLTDVLLCLTQ